MLSVPCVSVSSPVSWSRVPLLYLLSLLGYAPLNGGFIIGVSLLHQSNEGINDSLLLPSGSVSLVHCGCCCSLMGKAIDLIQQQHHRLLPAAAAAAAAAVSKMAVSRGCDSLQDGEKLGSGSCITGVDF